jgi:hypothetical protein
MFDWLDLFHQSGFEVLEQDPFVTLKSDYIRPERFVEPFRSKPIKDLAVLGVRMVARCK